ncbi:helix-turn-helix domain-containing protein [Streptomyces sp. NPDC058700]|uniref:helix-turn-helix domain-containing protein n=1 Tax=Streptomyces sp. NPDC058700 TaxID=3346607 RepID=UPI00365CD0C3
MATAKTPQPNSNILDLHLASTGSDAEHARTGGAAAPSAEYRRLHRVEDAAVFLSIKRTKAYEEVRLGRLRTVRIGRRRLVPSEYIDDYVELLKREAEAA